MLGVPARVNVKLLGPVSINLLLEQMSKRVLATAVNGAVGTVMVVCAAL